jgi:hypothetical protein
MHSSIILESFSRDELKEFLREIFEESLNKDIRPKEKVRTNPYLTRFQVVDMLQISLPTLNNWSKAGIVQSYRIGNRILYKLDEIEQAIRQVKNLKYKRG